MTLSFRANPVDAIEDVAQGRDWSFRRFADDEIALDLVGAWTRYEASFAWLEAHEALHVTCAFDLAIPSERFDEALRLVSQVNEQLVLGHFELWQGDGVVMFRHALPLHGGAEATGDQIEALAAHALDACERHYQAFQFVVWAGKSASDALESVLFETVGNA